MPALAVGNDLAGMSELRSGAAVFRTRSDGRISDWNDECERVTGIARDHSADGGLICHSGCSIARLARQGWPVRCTDLYMQTPDGPKAVTISTITLRDGDETSVLHPVREQAPAAARRKESNGCGATLTPRQAEILALMAEGVRAKQIAARLVLSETTVRNHIRAILLELGAHSQLEAVARARTLALVREEPAA